LDDVLAAGSFFVLPDPLLEVSDDDEEDEEVPSDGALSLEGLEDRLEPLRLSVL
jgi:hypothetical protein